VLPTTSVRSERPRARTYWSVSKATLVAATAPVGFHHGVDGANRPRYRPKGTKSRTLATTSKGALAPASAVATNGTSLTCQRGAVLLPRERFFIRRR
jgi:hypothetical protein